MWFKDVIDWERTAALELGGVAQVLHDVTLRTDDLLTGGTSTDCLISAIASTIAKPIVTLSEF